MKHACMKPILNSTKLFVLFLLCLCSPTFAEVRDINEDTQARDDARRLESLFRRIGNVKFAAGSIGKNHEDVKAAFRDSVKAAKRSTVIVKVDGRRKALGTVVDSDGYVITKASEVTDGVITCQLSGREVVRADLVGIVSSHDLAMLKLNRNDLRPINMKKVALPSIGAWLATCHLSSEPLAVGVVSVGARRIRPEHGVLGIEMDEAHTEPKVTTIMAGSGAAQAGMMQEDVVVGVEGVEVKTRFALSSAIRKYRPGDRVKIDVQRGEERITLTAKLGRFSDFDPNVIEFQSFVGSDLSTRRTGFQSVIQHDTVLLPNQCGGPVVDLDGRFVGINIARADRTASYLLPAVSIRPLISDLKAGKYMSKTRLTSKDK